MDILDTAAPEEWSNTYQTLYSADAIILVYSIIDKRTFQDLETYYPHIQHLATEKKMPPIILCGNKCDLENERAVTEEDGLSLAKSWRAIHFETSAKVLMNVDKMFEAATKAALQLPDTAVADNSKEKKEKKEKRCVLM